jgi:hypothetical protein
MRKYVLTLGALLLFTSPAFAAGYGDAGCGLGSLVFGSTPGPVQILAATTNGTSYSQGFGITSGTSNCDKESSLQSAQLQNQLQFVNANFPSLAKEMAIGEGEQLTTLAGMLGCSAAIAPEFGRYAQNQYEAIFASAQTTPTELLVAVKDGITRNPVLAASCSN